MGIGQHGSMSTQCTGWPACRKRVYAGRAWGLCKHLERPSGALKVPGIPLVAIAHVQNDRPLTAVLTLRCSCTARGTGGRM